MKESHEKEIELINEQEIIRGVWKTAKIKEVIKERDGEARSA
ncbi:unnamed protein product [Onchocerca flexuosa]|uniref:Transposase n=1 Tax=Onchocerca flexuosa TaxID=387005 RepID=A0A183HLT3_9BILA|nr:unnamed protein product [Onchocerca flexuosa]